MKAFRNFRELWIVCIAVALTGCGGGQPVDQVSSLPVQQRQSLVIQGWDLSGRGSEFGSPSLKPEGVEPFSPTQTVQDADKTQRMKRALSEGLVRQRIALKPFGTSEKNAFESQSAGPGIPERIAEGRALTANQKTLASSDTANWTTDAEGRQVVAWDFVSPEAKGLRIGVFVDRLPPEAVLRFLGSADAIEHVFSGEEVMRLLQRNLDSGDPSDAARTFWSPFLSGESATFVVEIPAGSSRHSVNIETRQLSHFLQSPTDEKSNQLRGIGTSASCNLDVNCYQESAISNSTAKMVYTGETGGSFLCSGTLMNDRGGTGTPYFLSANHCLSKQTAASTLQTFWFYRSATCGSSLLSASSVSRSGGATLLYASGNTDTSFLRLNNSPPPGASYSGWFATPLTIGAALTGVHHPDGDLQKVSFGQLRGYQNCQAGTGRQFSCSSSNSSSSNFFEVNFTSGTTQGGSSGSGLFFANQSFSSKVLVGQLYGGSSSCTNPSGSNSYGRFDVAYYAALNQWLDISPTPTSYVLNVVRKGTGVGTIASSPSGINCGLICAASFSSGSNVTLNASPALGYTFSGWGGSCAGTASSCTVSMAAAASVIASFSSPTIALGKAVDAENLNWITGGNAPFFGQAVVFTTGASSAQSGQISNGQASTLSTTVTGPGILKFDWKASSELDYDFLSFSLNGVTQKSISGETSQISEVFIIPSGSQVLQWKYAKDYSTFDGRDAGWVDNVSFVATTPIASAIQNGNFESGQTTWAASNTLIIGPNSSTITPASNGSLRSAWLCGYSNCDEQISQITTVQAGVQFAVLKFSYFVETLETTATRVYDTISIEIQDAFTSLRLKLVASLSNLDSFSKWQSVTSDISEFIGRTVKLVFSASTDSTFKTSFFIDDVSLNLSTKTQFKVQSGWFWNPNEGGRGFAIEQVGEKIFMAGFLYSDNGRPTWFTATGPIVGNVFTAQMRVYSNGQTLAGSYVAPTQSASSPGSISLNFSDSANAVMTWPGGKVVLQRFEIVPGSLSLPAKSFVPERGWWWNASEGGRGFALEVQGDNIFIAGFMYDTTGQPVWYASTGKMLDDQTYINTWTEYSGGQTMTGPFKSPSSTKPAGSIGINFPDPQNANLYLPNGVIKLTRFTSF